MKSPTENNTPASSGAPPDEHPSQHGGSSWLHLGLYLVAAIIYIAVGFVRQEVFAWWSYGAVWFVAVVWFGPPLIRRMMKRFRRETRPDTDST